jgi:hypothetical protein
MIGCPEASLRNYQSTLCKIPEECRSHLHCIGSLKSRISEEHTATIMTVFFKSDSWWNTGCPSETLVLIYQAGWCYYPMGRVHLKCVGTRAETGFCLSAKRMSPFKLAGASVQLLAAKVCASVIVLLDTSSSEVVWRVLATHSIRQFPLHFPSRASLCSITFQTQSNSMLFVSFILWRTGTLNTESVCDTSVRYDAHIASPLPTPWRGSFWLDSLQVVIGAE